MADKYYEQLVSRQPTRREKAGEAFVWAGAVLLSAAGFVLVGHYLKAYAIALLLAVLFVLLALLYGRRTSAEYEYQFVVNELRADRILSKGSRRSLTAMDLTGVSAFGRYRAGTKRRYRPYRFYYCCTGKDADAYFLFRGSGTDSEMLVFEPDETLLGHIREVLPRAALTEERGD